MKNRLITCILIITMVMAVAGNGYAFANEKQVMSTTDFEWILQDMGVLGNEDTQWTQIRESEGKNVIEVCYDGIVSTVEIISFDKKQYTVKCIEGAKENVLTKTADGRIVIDGKEVEYSADSNIYINPVTSLTINPLATETWFQNSCPYGSASAYSHQLTTYNYNKAAVKFNTALQNLTIMAFCTVMSNSIAGWLGFKALQGEFATNYILSELTNINGGSDTVSYTARVYTHQNYTNGFISPIITWVWKYKYQFYAAANYSGSCTTKTEYKCQM